MEVQVDNVWSSPSTLHMRISVWGPEHKWRQKFNAAVPLEAIPQEALAGVVAYFILEAQDDPQDALPGL